MSTGDRRFEIADLWLVVGGVIAGWAVGGSLAVLVVAGGIALGWRDIRALAAATAGMVTLAAAATVTAAPDGTQAFTSGDSMAASLGRVAGLMLLALVVVALLEDRTVRRVRWPALDHRPREIDLRSLSVSVAAIGVGAGIGALLIGQTEVALAGAVGAVLAVALGRSTPLVRLAAERSAGTGQVVRGSSWVMLGFVAQAGTGIVFWVVAARRFPAADVGLATGLFTSLQLVNFLTAMGLPELLARYHPDEGRRDPWFGTSLVTTVVTSLVGSVVFVGFVGTDTLAPLTAPGAVLGAFLFFVLSAGSAIALLVDARFMTSRRWSLVFWRLLVVGAVRIPLLWVPHGDADALWVFVVMGGPIAASGLWGLRHLLRGGLRPAFRLPQDQRIEAVRFTGVNYLAHLALLAPQFGLPVIVFLSVTPEDNAAFFLAWSIAAVAAIMPMTISRVLLSEGSRDPAETDRLTGSALRLALAVIAVATIAVLPAERLVVAVYGTDYRPTGTILPVLVAGCFPWAITVIAIAYSRVHHDHVGTIAMSTAVAVSVLGLAAFLVPDHGLDGGATAWFAGNGVAAVVAAGMFVRLRLVVRPGVAVAAHEGVGERRGEPVP